MKVQDNVSLVTVRVDPSCGLVGSDSSTRGESPIDRADERCERAEGSDTVCVRFVLDPLVVFKCLDGSFARISGAADVDDRNIIVAIATKTTRSARTSGAVLVPGRG